MYGVLLIDECRRPTSDSVTSTAFSRPRRRQDVSIESATIVLGTARLLLRQGVLDHVPLGQLGERAADVAAGRVSSGRELRAQAHCLVTCRLRRPRGAVPPDRHSTRPSAVSVLEYVGANPGRCYSDGEANDLVVTQKPGRRPWPQGIHSALRYLWHRVPLVGVWRVFTGYTTQEGMRICLENRGLRCTESHSVANLRDC